MGEPSLSRESGGVGPRCAGFPALNWTAETRAAAGGTAVTDIPHYCCCKCQSTTRNQSRLHWTHGQTQIYFMGRGVNRCVSMVMVCGGEGFSFLLMWQQCFFSQNLQQVTAWLTQAQTFFRFITALPGSFQPRFLPRNLVIYTVYHLQLFSSTDVKISLPAAISPPTGHSPLCANKEVHDYTSTGTGGERNIFSDICH